MRRIWPEGYTRKDLDEFDDNVECEIKVVQLRWEAEEGEIHPWDLVSKRDGVFAHGCNRLGKTCDPA